MADGITKSLRAIIMDRINGMGIKERQRKNDWNYRNQTLNGLTIREDSHQRLGLMDIVCNGPLTLIDAEIRDLRFDNVRCEAAARFARAHINHLHISKTIFKKTSDFSNMAGERAHFQDITFQGQGNSVSFDKVFFKHAHFENVRFENGASFKGAELPGVLVETSDMRNVDFSDAGLEGATFVDSDFRDIIWNENTNLKGVKLEGITMAPEAFLAEIARQNPAQQQTSGDNVFSGGLIPSDAHVARQSQKPRGGPVK